METVIRNYWLEIYQYAWLRPSGKTLLYYVNISNTGYLA